MRGQLLFAMGRLYGVVHIFFAVLLLIEKLEIGATVLTSGVVEFLNTLASYVKRCCSVAVANSPLGNKFSGIAK